MNATKKHVSDVYAVVLAGGSGTRLWPLSRGEYPKQLLKVSGENSLLQDTVLRLDGLGSGARTKSPPPLVVVCHEEQRFLIRDQLQDIDHTPERILLEPESRNTAPALCSAAHYLNRKGDDPVMVVLPADHAILDAEGLRSALQNAIEIAKAGFIVTLGVVPTRPDTGYGYIRRDTSTNVRVGEKARGHRIAAFVEKPNEKVAVSYVASGHYLWNSGVFILRASLWLEAVNRCRPEMLEACREAVEGGRDDDAFFRLERDAYARCPSDSIDYAVMERLSKSYIKPADDGRDGEPIPAAVVPFDAGWSDIGNWSALLEQQKKGDDGNSVQGDVVALETKNSLLISTRRLVAAYGLRDTVVVETPDAVLVMDKNQAQGVRAIVDQLNSRKRDETRTHRLVHRPWGSFESLESREGFQVKRLSVNPGAKLSLQLHHHRAEHWVVVQGVAKVTRGEEVFELKPNESTYIPVETKHRLENPGTSPLEVIEVQVGDYLGEDDIERFEDVYKRIEE
ncbi:MAG: mannose-1-phosphate guanylyltransferase/mannose-6-phosphate isomerase [Gammaproteobacteria bacterium]|nr:mannose-1-phosphate guanylyltransferase/mannose-6-phosphate isomerase [Gammaproteobacteria bacterium]